MEEKPQLLHTPVKKHKSLVARLILSTGALLLCGLLLYPFLSMTEDKFSEKERSKIIESMKNISPALLQAVTESEWDKAIATIPLDQKSKALLIEGLQRPGDQPEEKQPANESKLVLEEEVTRLVWIDLWDFADQDGDIVEISSAGYKVQVNLLKTPNRVAVPVNFSHIVTLTGVTDGGGGITLGVNSASSQNLIIEPGSSFSLPVSY